LASDAWQEIDMARMKMSKADAEELFKKAPYGQQQYEEPIGPEKPKGQIQYDKPIGPERREEKPASSRKPEPDRQPEKSRLKKIKDAVTGRRGATPHHEEDREERHERRPARKHTRERRPARSTRTAPRHRSDPLGGFGAGMQFSDLMMTSTPFNFFSMPHSSSSKKKPAKKIDYLRIGDDYIRHLNNVPW
jgi:hypothetical protein